MTTIADPILNSWYKDFENNLKFKIVAFDEKDETIEVQYLNGDIGEYDQESWYNSTFDFIEAPEDWSAPFDDVEDDDLGYSDDEYKKTNEMNLIDNLLNK